MKIQKIKIQKIWTEGVRPVHTDFSDEINCYRVHFTCSSVILPSNNTLKSCSYYNAGIIARPNYNKQGIRSGTEVQCLFEDYRYSCVIPDIMEWEWEKIVKLFPTFTFHNAVGKVLNGISVKKYDVKNAQLMVCCVYDNFGAKLALLESGFSRITCYFDCDLRNYGTPTLDFYIFLDNNLSVDFVGRIYNANVAEMLINRDRLISDCEYYIDEYIKKHDWSKYVEL